MKKLKNLVSVLSLLLYGQLALAQQQNGIGHVTLLKKNEQAKATNTSGIGHVTLLKKNALLVYLGAGSEGTSNSTKDETSLSNMTAIGLGLYLPIWQMPSYSIGISASGQYLSSNKEPLETTPQGYRVLGETATTLTARGSGSPKQAGFKSGVGPQMNIYLGNRFIASPILQAGYIGITQKEFSVEQTTDFNGTIYHYDLLKQTETKISGLAIIPKIRLHYMFTDWIGLWAEASYTAGPKIKNTVTRFAPDGSPNQEGFYNIDQLMTGTNTTIVGSTKYSAIGLGGGVVIALGNGKACITCGGTSTTPPVSVPTGGTTPKGKVEPAKVYMAHPWGRHGTWPICPPGGLFCRRWCGASPENLDYKAQVDETMGETTVSSKGNAIKITTIGEIGTLSEGMLDDFSNKKVSITADTLPQEMVTELFKRIKLPVPSENISFSPLDQSYEVVNTTFEGKPVRIIEVTEKTKLIIDGKEYNLTIITTSGRGSGSPKNQGF